MKDCNTATQSDLSRTLVEEFALAPYRAALRCASMAHLAATATLRMNRALIDAYRESVRQQQDGFSKVSTGILNRLSHNGASPAETMGAISQSAADMYRAATEGAAEFEQAMTNVREQCFAAFRGKPEHAAMMPAEAAGKKAA